MTDPAQQKSSSEPAASGAGPAASTAGWRSVLTKPKPLWPAAAVLLLVLVHAVIQLHWFQLDQSVGPSVQTGIMTPVSDLLHHRALGSQANQPAVFMATGWLPWAAALLAELLSSTSPDVLMWTILLFTAGTQLMLAVLGRQLGGPVAAVFLAGLYPLVPEIAMLSRRWAVMVPHHCCLAGAAVCLVASRSLTRPLPCIGFLAFTLAAFSALPPLGTEILLVVPALAGMALGAGLRGLVLGRGPRRDQPVARWRVLLVGGVTGALFIWAFWETGLIQSESQRVAEEAYAEGYGASFPAGHWLAWTAYLRYLGSAGLTPLFTLPLLVALAALGFRGQGRAELLGWVLVPILAFSPLAKKNPYYIHAVIPGLVVLLVVGLARLEIRAKAVGTAALAVLMVVAAQTWIVQSFPGRRPVIPTGPLLAAHPPRHAPQVFQSARIPQHLPQHRWPNAAVATLLLRCAEGASRAGPLQVQIMRQGDFTDARLATSLQAPQLARLGVFPDTSQLRRARCVILDPQDCGPGGDLPPGEPPPQWAAQSASITGSSRYTMVDRVEGDGACWALYRRR